MEQIKNTLSEWQKLPTMPCKSYGLKSNNDGNQMLSVYTDDLASNADIVQQTGRVMALFSLDAPTQRELILSIGRNKMTGHQLRDAVDYVVDNYRWRKDELKIADIVGFDRQVRLYSYDEMCANPTQYKLIKVNDKAFWVSSIELINKRLCVRNKKIEKI